MTVGNGNDYAFSLTLQPDGRILLAGSSWNGSVDDVSVIHLNTDGSLDTTFDGDGKLYIPPVGNLFNSRSVTVLPDGKILVAGDCWNGLNNDYGLIRLNRDGSLDTTFDSDGKLIMSVGSTNDRVYSVTVQPDGRIVVAGHSVGDNDYDFSLIRLNSNGSLDTTFNGTATNTLGGTVTYNEGQSPVVLDSDVRIVDAELSSTNFSGATLTLARNSGANSQDLFSATGTLAALIQGGNLSVDGTTIGTVTTNSGGTLVLTFNSSATNALVNSAMQQIAYANSSDAPPASVQIDWTLNDGNSGSQGTGGALTATGNVTVNITSVNDAPTITSGYIHTLSGTNEDATSPGTLASAILTGASWTDVDTGAISGLAITGVTGSGTWQYSTDGSTWTNFGSVSGTNALLITSSSQVRYIPNGQNGETATFTYKAWDQTSGTASTNATPSYASTASSGGTTTFSSNNATAQITVSSVNDTPLFSAATSGGGFNIISFGTGLSDQANRVARQSDGKILITGTTNSNYGVLRLNADGTVDTSFGTDGKVSIDVGGSDTARNIRVLSDGKLLLVGRSSNGSNNDFTLVRLNADGSLDTSFDGDGKRLVPVGTADNAYDVAVQSDGKMIVVGEVDSDFGIIRLNTDGSLDTTFSGDGKLTQGFGNSDGALAVALQSDGKIVVSGWSANGETAVIRLNTDGSFDNTFGTNGMITAGVSGYDQGSSIAIQSDGKIVVGGHGNAGSGTGFFLMRLNANGTIDTSFSPGGADGDGKLVTWVATNPEFGSTLTLQPDGKILMTGVSNGTFGIIRVNSDGSLDTSFGTGGRASIDVGPGTDESRQVLVLPDGKLIVIGFSINTATDGTSDFSVIRLNANGSLDTTFNGSSGGGLGTTLSYSENAPPIVLAGLVQISDVELTTANNFSGATLTLARNSGANSQDLFSATGTLGTLTQGGNLFVGGTTIGTVTSNSGGTLVLTFNSAATNALVNSAMQQIAYANSSDAPPASVQIDWTFSDGNSGTQGTGGPLSTTGNVIVNISSSNDAPSAANDTFATGKNRAFTWDVRSNDSDIDGPSLSVTQINGSEIPIGGAVAVTGGSVTLNANGTLTFTPTADWIGSPSFTYTVSDGNLTATATVAGTVAEVNVAPIAFADSATAVEAGGVNNGVMGTNPSGNVLNNDTDLDVGDTKTVIGVVAGTSSIASGNVSTSVAGVYGSILLASDGDYVYTVDNSNATVQALRTSSNTLADVFTYTMRDAEGLTSTTQVTITIQGANDYPTAIGESYQTNLLTPITMSLSELIANDTDAEGDALSIKILALPSSGSLDIDGNGLMTYRPDTNFVGTVTILYVVSDGSMDSLPQTVQIVIAPPANIVVAPPIDRPVVPIVVPDSLALGPLVAELPTQFDPGLVGTQPTASATTTMTETPPARFMSAGLQDRASELQADIPKDSDTSKPTNRIDTRSNSASGNLSSMNVFFGEEETYHTERVEFAFGWGRLSYPQEIAAIRRLELQLDAQNCIDPAQLDLDRLVLSEQRQSLESQKREYFVRTSTPIVVGTAIGAGISIHMLASAHFSSSLLSQSGVFMPLDPLTILEGSSRVRKSKEREDLLFESAVCKSQTS